MKIVVDTNVVVSAFLNTKGNESAVLDLVASRRVTLCVSDPVLAEYQVVTKRLGLDPIRVNAFLSIAGATNRVTPKRIITLSPDEADNRFYECAAAAKSDYLVTGNRKHFPQDYGRTKIVNAREFLELFTSTQTNPNHRAA